MSHEQNSGWNPNIMTANKSFENVAKFKYLGITPINQNRIHEEIKCRSNSRDACYHSIRNLSSSNLLSKKTKTKTFRITTLPLVLHGCETWSLTLREEHKLGLFKNRILPGPKTEGVAGEWRRLHKKELYEEKEITGNRGKLYNEAGFFFFFFFAPTQHYRSCQRKELHRFCWGYMNEEPHGRRGHRWENINTDLKEIWWRADGINPAQKRENWWGRVSIVISLHVPLNVRNFLTSWETTSFSRRTLLHGVRWLAF